MGCNVCDQSDSYLDFNYNDFSESAQAGCLRCAFITSCVELTIPHVESITKIITAWDNLMVVIDGEHYIHLSIYTSYGQETNPFRSCDSTKKDLKHLPGRTDSAGSIASMQRWLEECETTHDRCTNQHNHEPSQFNRAKRFLHLEGRSITLLEDIPVERYACLSHCWGISKPIKTTMDNLDSHRVEIPWGRLSATFQDAVDICSALDISYLWIDSLCIIQDSKDDWSTEAPKMADIYENACITIAATKSEDGTGGCFSSTAVNYMSKLVPGYKDTYVRQSVPDFPQLSNSESMDESMDWPLFNRAWIYQEMRLSRRVLHFCAQEVIWVCRTCQQSESGENDRDLVNYAPVGMVSDHHVPYASLEANPRRLWHRMIAEYSRLQLSFKGDKMAALAGLAQRMARLRSDDRYLTGSWEGSLLLDLLWARGLEATLDTQKLDRYPSWSWPSFDGQVIWFQDYDRTLESVCIEDISYTSCAQDFMCESAPITLTLRAPLLDAQTFFAHSDDYDDGLSQTITNLDHLYVTHATDDIEIPESGPDQSGFIIPISAESQESGFFEAIRVRQKPNSNCFERTGSVTLVHPAGRLCNDFGERLGNQEQRKTHLLSIRKLLESLPTSKIVLV